MNILDNAKDLLASLKKTRTNEPQNTSSFMISFGDPEPVLDGNLVNFGSFLTLSGEYYNPPISLIGLAKLFGANPYHAPILHFKKNMLSRWHKPTVFVDKQTLIDTALDFVTFGNAYFLKHRNAFGTVVRLSRLPAINMRPFYTPNIFIQLLTTQQQLQFGFSQQYIKYAEDDVIQIKESDVTQDLFGIPQYVGGIQSILLSEAATLFRRKYYINGAHLGYILVTNDANIDKTTEAEIKKNIENGKGAGNFRSIYINIPRTTSRDPVKVIPIGEIGTKDEFKAIKEVTEMEMCAMHRVYPSLAAIIPANTGGFGDIAKTLEVYKDVEVTPLQQRFLMINDIIGREAVIFE